MIANAIGVIEIATPLRPDFSPKELLVAAWEEWMETEGLDPNLECFRLVQDHERVHGYLDVFKSFESPLEGTVAERAMPITPGMIVSASTPLLEMPPLFEKHYFFFVLFHHAITHFVSFQDMDRLPMKLCLFSLLMDLEARILQVLTGGSPSTVQQYLGYLSKGRMEKARSLCEMKYDRESPVALLQCTTFIDKKQILRKDPVLFSKLPFESKRELDRFFKQAEDVRNQIAHSDSVIAHPSSSIHTLRTPEEYSRFVIDLERLIAAVDRLSR